MFIIERPLSRRHDEEYDHDRAQDKTDADIDDRLPACILLISRRQDHIIILHFPVGERIFQLSLFHLRLSGMLFYILHVPGGLLVVVVDLEHLDQGLSCLHIIAVLHVEEREEQMRLHEIRLLVDDPL